jgi:acetyltransferase-like isoleucine patch superfamily enzyme/SAM-dependent methyltransferase
MNFAVLILSPPNYIHNFVFEEVAETLNIGLKQLGYDSLITQSLLPNCRHIVLGTNLLPLLSIELPVNSILYNLEQISFDSPWINESLLNIFKKFHIWDYSLKNIEELKDIGITNVQHVPIGYVPELSRIPIFPEHEQDIDVLFYGSVNERRQSIIDALKSQKLVVESLFGVYGKERDQFIARSKILINIHFYESKIFEIVRLSYLFANKKFIVSERSFDDIDSDFFEPGLVFADYENLVQTCLDWLGKHKERAIISQKGFDLMSQREIVPYLAEAIDLTENHPPQNTEFKVDLGCGPRKAIGYVGVDIYPAPGVDIVADLTQRFPFEDSSVDGIRAHDFIEHLPDRIHTMNEIWRICKPGAMVDIFVPSTDGRGAFQDPTHISFWNINSFQYFAVEHPPYLELCKQYGFKGAFSLVDLKQYESPDQVIHVHALLRAVKDETLGRDNTLSDFQGVSFIVFPDWSQNEDILFSDFKTLLQNVATHNKKDAIILLIDTTGCDDERIESIESLISYICMDLSLSEEIDLEEHGLELHIMSESDYVNWINIKTKLVGRLILPHENEAAILDLAAAQIKSCFPENLASFLVSNQISVDSKVPWLKEIIHDNRIAIGAYTYADNHVNFVLSNPEDRISIGKFCSIASNVTIFGGGERYTQRVTTYPLQFLFLQSETVLRNTDATIKGHTQIGSDVWIGQGATILSGITVGDGVIIGAEAVVTRDVPAYSIVVGNPAKIIRSRFNPETIQKLLQLQWWDWPIEKIVENVDLLYQDPDRWTD